MSKHIGSVGEIKDEIGINEGIMSIIFVTLNFSLLSMKIIN